ncbi:MAG: metallophosphoesterase [Lachnospiraceae bacterium]|nr:metallophosphoesterase [Lachnospiraceae bacterium]
MKILALADEESPYLWDHFDKNYFKDIDLILSCGDLKAEYLSFLVTLTNIPLVYVPGNHDKGYVTSPPEGCICADDTVVCVRGLRIAGLGGCMKYNGGPYQYTEARMRRRVMQLYYPIYKHGGIDIFLTHAPSLGHGDDLDLPHHGFDCFNKLIDRFQPSLMVHGHTHLSYNHNLAREEMRNNTRIINAYEKYIIEL